MFQYNITFQALRNREGGWVACRPPRFLLKWTFYQLTMIVKRRTQQKNKLFKFLWQHKTIMHKTIFYQHCIFYTVFLLPFTMTITTSKKRKRTFHKIIPFSSGLYFIGYRKIPFIRSPVYKHHPPPRIYAPQICNPINMTFITNMDLNMVRHF